MKAGEGEDRVSEKRVSDYVSECKLCPCRKREKREKKRKREKEREMVRKKKI
jgi:hypothetical protein